MARILTFGRMVIVSDLELPPSDVDSRDTTEFMLGQAMEAIVATVVASHEVAGPIGHTDDDGEG